MTISEYDRQTLAQALRELADGNAEDASGYFAALADIMEGDRDGDL